MVSVSERCQWHTSAASAPGGCSTASGGCSKTSAPGLPPRGIEVISIQWDQNVTTYGSSCIVSMASTGGAAAAAAAAASASAAACAALASSSFALASSSAALASCSRYKNTKRDAFLESNTEWRT